MNNIRKVLFSALMLTSLSALSIGLSKSASSAITSNYDIVTKGKASWIGERFQGKKTASGELFDMNDLTASHATLPFGTLVKVFSDKTKKSVTVRINNRSEIDSGRIIDLSKRAAEQIGLIEEGIGLVTLEVVTPGAKNTSTNTSTTKSNNSLASANSNSKYVIQYGSFFDLDNAIELKQGLKAKGVETTVESTKTDSGKTSYRVNSIKSFNNSDDAKRSLSLIEPQDGIIVSVKSPSNEVAKTNTTTNKSATITANNSANSNNSASKKYEYGIQFGAFETVANARELQNKLLVEKGIKTITYQFPDDSRKLYRVLTNHAFPTKEAAQKFLKEMESQGIILTFL
jgi:rare lipoprotein A